MNLDLLPQLILNGIVLGAHYGALTIGLSLIIGVTGRFHFAYGLSFTLAGFVAALSLGEWHLGRTISVVAAVAAAIGLGVLIEVLVYRPLARDLAASGHLLAIFVSSLGITIAGTNLIQLLWASVEPSKPYPLVPSVTIRLPLGLTTTRLDVIMVTVLLAASAGVIILVGSTRWGRSVRAVRANPMMASVVGISPGRVFITVFAIGSAMAGLSGVFGAAKLAATPDMATQPLFTAFVVAFLAGTTAPLTRVLAVGIGMGVLQTVSGLWLAPNLTSLIIFGVLFIFISSRAIEPRALFLRRSEAASA